jgi:cupin fold WbuC family metalloprotein
MIKTPVYISVEVYQLAISQLPVIDQSLVSWLKKKTQSSGKCRVLFHPSSEALLQEMLIIHKEGVYVRPHRHVGKTESYHVLEGRAELVFFEENGKPTKVIVLEPYPRTCFVRIPDRAIHTLIIKNDLVFIETTTGPFDKTKTFFPDWAPQPSLVRDVRRFLISLRALIKRLKR